MEYKKRIVDEKLKLKLRAFGATLITGPKGCGKTTTAKQHANSIVEFQDEDRREAYLSVVKNQPSRLLEGEKPRLFDEWQDAPKIWGAIRKSVDDSQKTGQYILTGSTSQSIETPHTGTLRISRISMLPMSLFESGESNGTVSLIELFNDPNQFNGCKSDLSIDKIIYSICRGGWPSAVNLGESQESLEIAKDLFRQTCEIDISNIDKIKRNPKWAETILRSYARNICTLADMKTIINDVKATSKISEATIYDYTSALEKLFIIQDVVAWNPSIRSKTSIRASTKKNLVDPSIAVAALGIGPKYFDMDFNTLGFLFESLSIRDLKIYSSLYNGDVSYYRDRYGLEADAVLHLDDGRYALCEIKLGENDIDEGAEHLVKIENLIKKHNEHKRESPLRLPDLKIVITGTEYGYRRDDGVFVIPLACLRE